MTITITPIKGTATKGVVGYAIALVLIMLTGCAAGDVIMPPESDAKVQPAVMELAGGYIPWGTWQLKIARDGSEYEVIPERYAEGTWGVHLNAVKLLEAGPGYDCIKLSNVHALANGDVSIDITLTHPFDNAICTGFDVRGIIMFPASYYFPDWDLRYECLGDDDPCELWGFEWMYRLSSAAMGDAELMNSDGWTYIWAPEIGHEKPTYWYELETGFPIFDYYKGKYASGKNIATINGYKHYWTNDERHMFEIGKKATRTYIIRPPADGPIQAHYAVYAHWAPPINTPVTNPVVDFGPEANSPMPYEFWIEQVAPMRYSPTYKEWHENGQKCLWHIKTWHHGLEYWGGYCTDYMYVRNNNSPLLPHPNGMENVYYMSESSRSYTQCPQSPFVPGYYPYMYRFFVHAKPTGFARLCGDWYFKEIYIEDSE